jgi:hypothetical protein
MLEQLKAGHTAEMVTMINKQPKWNDTVRVTCAIARWARLLVQRVAPQRPVTRADVA